MMEVVVTIGAIRRAKLQSNRQQTNTQLCTGRMLFLSPNQQLQSTEGKIFFIKSTTNISLTYISPLSLSFLTLISTQTYTIP